VRDFGIRFPTTTTWCNGPGRNAEQGDVLLSVRAPVGRLNFAPSKMIIGRGLSALRANGGYQSLLFHHLRAFFFVEDRIGSGAIYAAVTRDDVLSIEILKPPPSIAKEFEDIVGSIESQVRVLDQSNSKLRDAAALLLPRLMSGEVEA
jgi:type I restriction enzyme, S subunit